MRNAHFVREARARFEFLREADLLEPEESEFRISYRTGRLGVDVLYDDRDGRVATVVRAQVVDRSPAAGLQCLYVASGLGPAQDIREIARSNKVLAAVLESHAAALKKVLPILRGAEGQDLLLRCHGR